MDKPEDIPQEVWDRAFDIAYDISSDGYGGVEYHDAHVTIARAILKAKNDAYEEAANMIDTGEYEMLVYEETHLDAMFNLSQAIRNLKHEG